MPINWYETDEIIYTVICSHYILYIYCIYIYSLYTGIYTHTVYVLKNKNVAYKVVISFWSIFEKYKNLKMKHLFFFLLIILVLTGLRKFMTKHLSGILIIRNWIRIGSDKLMNWIGIELIKMNWPRPWMSLSTGARQLTLVWKLHRTVKMMINNIIGLWPVKTDTEIERQSRYSAEQSQQCSAVQCIS